jgi:hypothetical protein
MLRAEDRRRPSYRGDEAASLALAEVEREKEKMEAWRNLKSLTHEKDRLAAKTLNMEARMESEVERHMEVFKGEISTESGAEVMGRLNEIHKSGGLNGVNRRWKRWIEGLKMIWKKNEDEGDSDEEDDDEENGGKELMLDGDCEMVSDEEDRLGEDWDGQSCLWTDQINDPVYENPFSFMDVAYLGRISAWIDRWGFLRRSTMVVSLAHGYW